MNKIASVFLIIICLIPIIPANAAITWRWWFEPPNLPAKDITIKLNEKYWVETHFFHDFYIYYNGRNIILLQKTWLREWQDPLYVEVNSTFIYRDITYTLQSKTPQEIVLYRSAG